MATEKRMLCTVIVIAILAGMLCGFSPKAKEEPTVRFEVYSHTKNITVITDNDTGVQYLAYRTAYGTGLTKLEVADGN